NVLISSAGRRVTLMNLWGKAIADLGLTGEIIATDASPMAAAWQQATVRHIVPRCDSPDYADAFMQICKLHDVRVVVPTIDTELAQMAALRPELEAQGTTVLVSSPDCIRVTGDKATTNRWLISNGFPTVAQADPATVLANRNKWPLPL